MGKTLRERIAEGECVSELTVDRCPVCTDVCRAYRWKMEMKHTLIQAKVLPSPNTESNYRQG